MCDYSLMYIPNRLAMEGEDLVTHQFEAGTMSLACQTDLQVEAESKPAAPGGFWAALKAFFAPPAGNPAPAVCVPPGARLLLMDIPEALRQELEIGRVEDVAFTQITAAANSYRDAVRFRNGREILLQRLSEGQRVRVIALGASAETKSVADLSNDDCRQPLQLR